MGKAPSGNTQLGKAPSGNTQPGKGSGSTQLGKAPSGNTQGQSAIKTTTAPKPADPSRSLLFMRKKEEEGHRFYRFTEQGWKDARAELVKDGLLELLVIGTMITFFQSYNCESFYNLALFHSATSVM